MITSLHAQRILIVEDEYLLGISLHDSLEDAGATVIGPLGNVDDALHVLQTCDVDAAVLDVNLKGTHVYPVADRLQEQNVPFIFTSGYDARFIPERFGNRPLIPKPCDHDALCAALESVIAG